MTPQELIDKVFALIDEHCMEMSQEEYLEALQGIRDDAGIRAEAVQNELEDDDNG